MHTQSVNVESNNNIFAVVKYFRDIHKYCVMEKLDQHTNEHNLFNIGDIKLFISGIATVVELPI